MPKAVAFQILSRTFDYEYKEVPMSDRVILGILTDHLHFKSWSTVREIQVIIEKYHLQKGGGKNELKEYNAQVREKLKKLCRQGIYKRTETGKEDYYRHIFSEKEPNI